MSWCKNCNLVWSITMGPTLPSIMWWIARFILLWKSTIQCVFDRVCSIVNMINTKTSTFPQKLLFQFRRERWEQEKGEKFTFKVFRSSSFMLAATEVASFQYMRVLMQRVCTIVTLLPSFNATEWLGTELKHMFIEFLWPDVRMHYASYMKKQVFTVRHIFVVVVEVGRAQIRAIAH